MAAEAEDADPLAGPAEGTERYSPGVGLLLLLLGLRGAGESGAGQAGGSRLKEVAAVRALRCHGVVPPKKRRINFESGDERAAIIPTRSTGSWISPINSGPLPMQLARLEVWA
jgi:hypothetical protein